MWIFLSSDPNSNNIIMTFVTLNEKVLYATYMIVNQNNVLYTMCLKVYSINPTIYDVKPSALTWNQQILASWYGCSPSRSWFVLFAFDTTFNFLTEIFDYLDVWNACCIPYFMPYIQKGIIIGLYQNIRI